MSYLISGYGPKGQENLQLIDSDRRKIWSDRIESPSFVITSGDAMFTVTENDHFSIIYSYIRNSSGGYDLRDCAGFEGTDICHLAYSPKAGMIFGSCWGSGHLVYARVGKDLRFYGTGSVFQENDTGDSSRETRVHFSLLNRAEDTLMVNNVGLDIVYFYGIEDGRPVEKDRIYTEKGQHPRHSVFNRDETLLYIVTELSNEILVYEMPSKKLMQRISTLQPGFTGKSHCSAICLSPDERTVYAANRYSESIAVFKADENGMLVKAMQIPSHGIKPRHMILTKGGTELVICYQVSGEVVFVTLDGEGMPTDRIERYPLTGAAGIAEIQ